MSRTSLVLAWLGLLGWAVSPASADLLFSNLGQVQDNDAGIALTSHRPATEFLTGGVPTIATDLTIRVNNFDSVGHTFGAYLYSDNAGSPNSLLATFSPVDNSVGAAVVPGVTGTMKLITFSHAGINLAASTQYWVALSLLQPAVAHSVAWIETTSNAEDIGSLFTNDSPPNRFYSLDSGSTWGSPGPARNGQFSLEGTAVPEPTSAALVLLGGVASGAAALRRRRAAKAEPATAA